jgi:hypothetical protein
MGSLGLHADPDGWLNAGYSVRTLMDSLDSELYDADRIGGAGLSQSWAGPVADAFTGHWSGVRSRAEDLIAQGRRAAAAITDFGGRLEDFVRRAADLESYWLSFGLQLGLDGMHFALPWGFEQLPPVHQVSFHQWLTESERDVTAMWSDIRAAVDDVVTALESLIAAFEDFEVVALSMAAGVVGGYLGGYLKDPLSLVDDGMSEVKESLDWARNHALDDAYKTVVAAGEDADRDATAAADATKAALRYARVAEIADDVEKVGGRVLLVAAVGMTAWETYGTAKKHGWVDAVEDHAGDIASLALITPEAVVGGVIAAALLPEAAVGVGAIVATGIVAFGVSEGVQWVVDHNKTTINHAVTDISRGAGVTAKAVGHGVEDAAAWEARHAEGLAKFA